MTPYQSIRRDQKLAETYISITKAEGPSPQLLAFMLHDDPIALESLYSQDYHEKILNDISQCQWDEIAQEALADQLLKAAEFSSKFLKDGLVGAIRGKIANMIILAGMSAATIMTKKIIKKIREHQNANVSPDDIISYNDFTKVSQKITQMIQLERAFLQAIPDGFRVSEWEDFKNHKVIDTEKKLADLGDYELALHMFDQSGWTPDNFKHSVSTFVHQAEAVLQIDDDFKIKLKTIALWLRRNAGDISGEEYEISKLIGDTLGGSLRGYRIATIHVDYLKSQLNKIAHHFEEEE